MVTRTGTETQGYADTNNIQKFYESTKRIYGPTRRSVVPVKGADGQTPIRDREGILKRWAEHFKQLPNNHTTSDHQVLNEIPSLPTQDHLDLPQPCRR